MRKIHFRHVFIITSLNLSMDVGEFYNCVFVYWRGEGCIHFVCCVLIAAPAFLCIRVVYDCTVRPSLCWKAHPVRGRYGVRVLWIRLLPSSRFIIPQSSSLEIWCPLRVTLSCIHWLYIIASILFCKHTRSPHASPWKGCYLLIADQ